MVADQCTIIRASWNITEGSCTNLSYEVTLLSFDGVMLQDTTSDTVFDFTNVETLIGPLTVTVVPINGNVRGASITETAVISISQNGLLYYTWYINQMCMYVCVCVCVCVHMCVCMFVCKHMYVCV